MYNLHKLISIYLCVRGRCHICTTYSETVRRHGDTNMCDDQGCWCWVCDTLDWTNTVFVTWPWDCQSSGSVEFLLYIYLCECIANPIYISKINTAIAIKCMKEYIIYSTYILKEYFVHALHMLSMYLRLTTLENEQ